MAAFDIFLEFRLLVDGWTDTAVVLDATLFVSKTDISIWQDILLSIGGDDGGVKEDVDTCANSFDDFAFVVAVEDVPFIEDIDTAK